ncbi:hypothetical protein AK830_g925 [Neonectria ditissima]|uniref:Uncharacterized protein n=1 Tax=Neonectria ditissima TaxID=78410 RepID=A0A0P7C0Y4_9HYPO|nr:hypothetical protein AK830_g925 [Neonectria ditissima]
MANTRFRQSVQEPLYSAITLEVALTNVCKQNDTNFDGSSLGESDTLMTQQQAFSCFVNKLAQVCDNRRRGKTTTSFVVLQGDTGPVYVFASNQRTEAELVQTQVFVSSLLRFVGDNATELPRRTLEKQVLWRVMSFNLPRIEQYLDGVNKYLDKCMEDCQRRGGSQDGKLVLFRIAYLFKTRFDSTALDSGLQRDLHYLKNRANFPRDFLAPGNARDKSKDGEFANSEIWCELRHYLGRLLSYRRAAETIVAFSVRWPGLFQHFQVQWIPSSTRIPKPISNTSLTAKDIICSMVKESEGLEGYVSQAETSQMFNLDKSIQKQIAKKTFFPYVHAEVELHNWLLAQGYVHRNQFWNEWKYIGCSKPTCRLCSYYFNAHPDQVQVRQSHFNLYPNWRLPDVFESQGPAAVRMRLEILQTLTDKVRSDALRTLDEKVPRGK